MRKKVDRIVFEIGTSFRGAVRVEASQVQELSGHLQRLVPDLDSYAARGAAHLAFVERASIQGPSWGVRRLGVLQFQADAQEVRPVRRRVSGPSALPVAMGRVEPLGVPAVRVAEGAVRSEGERLMPEPLLRTERGPDLDDSGDQ